MEIVSSVCRISSYFSVRIVQLPLVFSCWVAVLIGRAALVRTEIAQQLFDALPEKLIETCMLLRGFILITTIVDPVTFPLASPAGESFLQVLYRSVFMVP